MHKMMRVRWCAQDDEVRWCAQDDEGEVVCTR